MPEYLSQIYITDKPGALPPALQQASQSLKNLFPEHCYLLFGLDDLRGLITKCFDAPVLRAFDGLAPYSYKSDLGRFCILYEFGGWYFDIAIAGHQPITVGADLDAIFFRDIQRYSGSSWSVQGAAIYAKPRNPIFLSAIQQVIENHKNNFYGITPLCPTGPTLLGQAIARHGTSPRIIFGDFLALTPLHANLNTAFVLPDGQILAWGKRAQGGDLTALGAVGSNNYNELWKNRAIYL
jgi:mannosyltransferase OCH1-like enzyme